MPFTKAIELAPLEVHSAPGAGQSVSTTPYWLARLSLNLGAVVGGPVTVFLDTSADGSAWTQVYTSGAQSTAVVLEASVPSISTHLRTRWTFGTGTTSLTFDASALLVMAYAKPADLFKHAIPQAALGSISMADVGEELVTASEVADGFLGTRYTLPLQTWGGDLTRAVCHLAEFNLLTTRGVQAEGDSYTILLHRYESAMTWLSDVAKGRVHSPHISDSSVVQSSSRVHVATSPLRGW